MHCIGSLFNKKCLWYLTNDIQLTDLSRPSSLFTNLAGHWIIKEEIAMSKSIVFTTNCANLGPILLTWFIFNPSMDK